MGIWCASPTSSVKDLIGVDKMNSVREEGLDDKGEYAGEDEAEHPFEQVYFVFQLGQAQVEMFFGDQAPLDHFGLRRGDGFGLPLGNPGFLELVGVGQCVEHTGIIA